MIQIFNLTAVLMTMLFSETKVKVSAFVEGDQAS